MRAILAGCNLSKSKRDTVAAGFLEHEREQARKRMGDGGKGGLNKGVESFPPLDQAKARDKAGERIGVSGRYVIDAEKIIKTAAPDPVENAPWKCRLRGVIDTLFVPLKPG